MMRTFGLTIVAMTLALVALAGCAGSGGAGGGGPAQEVTLKGLDTMRFEPATITVKANQPVKLTVQNTGQLRHDFKIKGMNEVSIAADGGKTVSGTFTLTKPGTYEFYCSEAGHEAAGMKGTIVAQ